jgi:hypothetical protein
VKNKYVFVSFFFGRASNWASSLLAVTNNNNKIIGASTCNMKERKAVLCRPKNFGRHCLSIQKKNCNRYFIVIMITILITNVIFWVVNFKTQNYFVISTTQNVYLRLSMYNCSNFVYSCRIFGISELQTV